MSNKNNRPRYGIARMFICKLHDWRWMVLDYDFDKDSGSRYKLSDYTFETADAAMTFCEYLNKEGVAK